MKKKSKIGFTSRLILPLIAVIIIQMVLPFVSLLASNVKGQSVDNTLSVSENIISNKKDDIEDKMTSQWSAIRKESDSINEALETYFKTYSTNMDEFLASKDMQTSFISNVFTSLFDTTKRDYTSGSFLILNNSGNLANANDYVGYYLRDTEPDEILSTNTDLILVRGSSALNSKTKISLDSNYWSPKFHFKGEGNSLNDNFFYKPLKAGMDNLDADMEDLGYWSTPMVLEDNTEENYQMITYSLPLIYNGTVYGVLGSEISITYLQTFLEVSELDKNSNAGYVLSIQKDDNSYLPVATKGSLYNSSALTSGLMILKKTSTDGLYIVDGFQTGNKDVYSMTSSLHLYETNVPYEDTSWVLCGLISESAIYDFGNNIINIIFITLFLTSSLSLIVMLIVVSRTTKPLYTLMDSVRGGTTALKKFKPSNIKELDELHDVIETLTDSQKFTADQLKEEKERYQVAVKSSNDIFYSYKVKTNTVEITNSKMMDGEWNLKVVKDQLSRDYIYPEDLEKLKNLPHHLAERSFREEIRVKTYGESEYHWCEIVGNNIGFGEEQYSVGFVRDIHTMKLLEQEQEKKRSFDTVTGFYRFDKGFEVLRERRYNEPYGTLMLIDIRSFNVMNDKYGITFGDILLTQFAKMVEKRLSGEDIVIRAGSDVFAIWTDVTDYDAIESGLRSLEKDFISLVHNNILPLGFITGYATVKDEEITNVELLNKANDALEYAKRNNFPIYRFDAFHYPLQNPVHFPEIQSLGLIKEMSLSAIALYLIDQTDNIIIAFDLISKLIDEKYHIKNLIVTNFRSDYLSSSIEYEYHPNLNNLPRVIHATKEEFNKLTTLASSEQMIDIAENEIFKQVFTKDIYGINFLMLDNSKFSGSIYVIGLTKNAIAGEKENTDFLETCQIIQNRLNQIHHDAYARSKSDFLARMSHEIRTPMNGIIGMTEIALKPNQSEAKRIDCLQKVKQSSNYLLGLINDILDMSKIESGKMNLVLNPFSLQALIDETNILLDAKIQEKKQKYIKHVDLKHKCFVGDELRIKQVVINLLGNAMKYSDNEKTIDLIVKEYPLDDTHSNVYFAVKDEGIGVSEQDKTRIFQSFEQVDATSVKQQGTGLGLAISNRLVNMMDSNILLESTLGKGSTFYFTITLEIAKDIVVEAKASEEKVTPRKDLTILVVEDNDLNMEIITTLLADEGISFIKAGDGLQAVEQFKKSKPGSIDLVLMDIMMPNMNGLEATQAIRNLDHKDAKTVPIVAMSANAFDEDVKKSLEAGMNAHLAKPINMKKFFKTIYALTGKK